MSLMPIGKEMRECGREQLAQSRAENHLNNLDGEVEDFQEVVKRYLEQQ